MIQTIRQNIMCICTGGLLLGISVAAAYWTSTMPPTGNGDNNMYIAACASIGALAVLGVCLCFSGCCCRPEELQYIDSRNLQYYDIEDGR